MASETWFGSGEYSAPVKMHGIVSPQLSTIIVGGGTALEQNREILQFEAKAPHVSEITQNSHFWIRKEPDPAQEGGDFTHAVVSREAIATGFFVSIEVRSVAGDTPIV
jgi:hypothetical protein